MLNPAEQNHNYAQIKFINPNLSTKIPFDFMVHPIRQYDNTEKIKHTAWNGEEKEIVLNKHYPIKENANALYIKAIADYILETHLPKGQFKPYLYNNIPTSRYKSLIGLSDSSPAYLSNVMNYPKFIIWTIFFMTDEEIKKMEDRSYLVVDSTIHFKRGELEANLIGATIGLASQQPLSRSEVERLELEHKVFKAPINFAETIQV